MSYRIRGAATAAATVTLLIPTAPAALAEGGSTEGVDARNFDFGPGKVRIKAGDKVRWTNVEGAHTVTFDNGFDELLSGEGDSAARRFKRIGTFAYVCTFHDDQGMRGKVIVRK